jgi:hypothetical protein
MASPVYTEYMPKLPCKITSGNPVPPGGLLQLQTVAGGIWTVSAPASDSNPFVFLNGPNSLSPGELGEAIFELVGVAAYHEGDGTPNIGEEWGSATGSFMLRSGRTGFRIIGEPSRGLVAVARAIPPVAASSPSFFNRAAITRIGFDALGQLTWETRGFAIPSVATIAVSVQRLVSTSTTVGATPVASATVAIVETASNDPLDRVTAQTNASGQVRFDVPAGNYAITTTATVVNTTRTSPYPALRTITGASVPATIVIYLNPAS